SLVLFLPRRRIVGVLLLVLLVEIGIWVGYSRIKPTYEKFHSMVVDAQIGFLTTRGSSYRFLPERYKPRGNYGTMMTAGEWVESYFKAVYYYLSVPNPFVRLKASKVPVTPQMLVWYGLMIICFPVGVLYLVKHRYRESGIVLMYILVFTSALALNTANEGAAFRQRDMLVPFYFIPISIGLIKLLGWISSKITREPDRLRPFPETSPARDLSS
ncbi:MAG: hypothetical protein U9P14_09160, partial [Gemmatimonadota bacterium]|nr:hypothetical protein [Gemmatimonadota bacterium]